jgi:hypothetical protein
MSSLTMKFNSFSFIVSHLVQVPQHSTLNTLNLCSLCVRLHFCVQVFLLKHTKHIESNYTTQRDESVEVHTLMRDTTFHTHTEVYFYMFQSPR